MILLALGLVARAACEPPVPTSDVYQRIEAAHASFADLDIEGFRAGAAQVSDLLPCVREPVDRHLTAEIHRLFGLRSAAEANRVGATEAFAAARFMEPDYRFPDHLIPSGSPVLDLYFAIPPENWRTVDVPEPADGRLEFDGRPSTRRPTSWPTLVQVFDGGGAVTTTAYLLPSDVMPDYPVLAPPPPPPPPPRIRVPLLVTAGVALAATGAVSIAGMATTARYNAESTPDADLPRLRERSNALAYVAIGGLATSAVLGAAVAIAW